MAMLGKKRNKSSDGFNVYLTEEEKKVLGPLAHTTDGTMAGSKSEIMASLKSSAKTAKTLEA